ncbi:MAG: glycosyltransferase [Acidimicrobiia bacterium]
MAEPTVLFVAAIWDTLRAFMAPVAEEFGRFGVRTIAASAGSPATHEGFDDYVALHEYRRRGAQHVAIAARDLARYVRAENVSLLHLHTPAAVAIGRVVSRMTGVPAVAVVHGSFLGAGGTSEYLFRSVERSTAWMAKATVTVNDSDAEYYRQFLRFGSVSVAPAGGGGIDDDRIRHAVTHHSTSTVGDGLVGYVGRLTPDKGLDFLVEAVRRARRGGRDVRLRLIGSTASGEKGWQVPRESWIEATGWLADPYEAVAGCDVMASASRREGFGMGVAEALVMGKPVVALSNAGARQQKRLAGERLTITEANVSTFADALCLALDHGAAQPSSVQADLAEAWSQHAVVAFYANQLRTLVSGIVNHR